MSAFTRIGHAGNDTGLTEGKGGGLPATPARAGPRKRRIVALNARVALYVSASKLGSELLFDVISTAYERTSVIVTTNLPFEQWPEVLGSERRTPRILYLQSSPWDVGWGWLLKNDCRDCLSPSRWLTLAHFSQIQEIPRQTRNVTPWP